MTDNQALRFADYLSIGIQEHVLFIVYDNIRLVELASRLRDHLSVAGYSRCHILNQKDIEDLSQTVKRYSKVVLLCEDESFLSKEVLACIELHPKKEFFRVFDFSEELLLLCFNVPQEELKQLNGRLISRLAKCNDLRVANTLGTNLHVSLTDEYSWINTFGHFDGRFPGITPGAEVATYSEAVNGRFVADGAINTNFGFPISPLLEKCPVVLEIENGLVVSSHCDYSVIDKLLKHYFTFPNSNRVGEIGFGTNYGIKNFVKFVSHINERYSTFHLGLGAHQQAEELVGWGCPFHLDLMLDECEMFADGELLHQNNRYLLDQVDDLSRELNLTIGYVDTV